MSLYSEIERIAQAKAELKDALEAKGATIDDDATIDAYVEVVDDLSGDTGKSMIEREEQYFTLDKSITKIGDYAFYHNTALTGIEVMADTDPDTGEDIPVSNIISIGDHAFDNCSNIEYALFWGQPMLWYGSSVFYNCDKLAEYDSPILLTSASQVPSNGSLQHLILRGAVDFGFSYSLGSALETVDAQYCSKVPNINATVLANISNAEFNVPTVLYEKWSDDPAWSGATIVDSGYDRTDWHWSMKYLTNDDSSIAINEANSICTVLDHYYDDNEGAWIIEMYGPHVLNSSFFGSNVNKLIDFYFNDEMLYIGNVFKNNYGGLETIHFTGMPPKFGWGNADDNNYNTGLYNSDGCSIYIDNSDNISDWETWIANTSISSWNVLADE